MAIKALFFDVGNTLLFPNRERMLRTLHDTQVFPSEELLLNIERQTKREFDSLLESRAAVQPELGWEPEVARLGRAEHERLARAARARLIVFEVGDGQADTVAAMLRELGCADVAITADLTGRDRVVEGRLP